MTTTVAAIGFRTKTAKAIALAVSGADVPEFIGRWNLDLYDPAIPESGQPHHQVMELPWARAQVEVRPFEKVIEDVATQRLRDLLEELRGHAVGVRSIAVVGSPDRNIDKIGNPHIRAHAAEGILFRRAMQTAAARCKLSCRQLSDRDLEAFAAKELHCTAARLKSVLSALGRSAGRPWRADERAAAIGGWIALSTPPELQPRTRGGLR